MNEAKNGVADSSAKVNLRAGKNNPAWKHGCAGTPEYNAWRSMKKRILNPVGMDAEWYRGIKIHPDWIDDPIAFINHIGPQPTPQHSIDRYPNRNGNYEPGNVRWATWTEQNRNKDGLRWIEYNGELICVAELAERFSIPYFALYSRLFLLNWEIERAVSTPVKKHDKIHYKGKDYSMRGLVREFATVNFNTFRYRLKIGMTLEEALLTPAHHTKLG